MAKAAANGGDGAAPPEAKPRCGIVMPISAIEDCSADHWAEILAIVQSAADMAGFDGRLVSAADYAGIILKQIIQNLYDDPIVVCDVSARNPNVMFELGLRLAFDKPTILIKDDKTEYAFDTSPIEHLDYPRGLRFTKIVEFKERLAEKIQGTYKQATSDKSYTTFLKHFGTFKVATVDVKQVPGQEFIMEELSALKAMIRELSVGQRQSREINVSASRKWPTNSFRAFVVRGIEPARLKELCGALEKTNQVRNVRAEVIDDEIILTLSSLPWHGPTVTHKLVQQAVRQFRKDAAAYEVDTSPTRSD